MQLHFIGVASQLVSMLMREEVVNRPMKDSNDYRQSAVYANITMCPLEDC